MSFSNFTHPGLVVAAVYPILVKLDDVWVFQLDEIIKHLSDLFLLSFEVLAFREANFVPNHLDSFLRVHGKVGGIYSGHVSLLNLQEQCERMLNSCNRATKSHQHRDSATTTWETQHRGLGNGQAWALGLTYFLSTLEPPSARALLQDFALIFRVFSATFEFLLLFLFDSAGSHSGDPISGIVQG